MYLLISGVIEVNDLITSPKEIQESINSTLAQNVACNYLNGEVAVKAISPEYANNLLSELKDN